MNTQVLQLIDALAIAFAQAYMLARSRMVSHTSPTIRLMAQRDHVDYHAKLLERVVAIYRAERERLPSNRRWQYSPESRLEILQLIRLAGWSTKEAGKQFSVHPNTIRGWRKALRNQGDSSSLFIAPSWNRIHDSVRCAVHYLRSLCPEAEFGTRAIARHLLRAGIQIHRSSVQRMVREDPPKGRPVKPPLIEAEGCESTCLLAPKKVNAVWHLDIVTVQLLWMKFSVVGMIDGFSRRVIKLKVFSNAPSTNDILCVTSNAFKAEGKPRFMITDHGCQFRSKFKKQIGVEIVKGRVRCPAFNGKVERLFKTLRVWLRRSLLPVIASGLQKRMDRYAQWYNEHRPHSALGIRTPNEVHAGIKLPEPIPFRAADPIGVSVNIYKQPYRGDPSLPVISISVNRKEAA